MSTLGFKICLVGSTPTPGTILSSIVLQRNDGASEMAGKTKPGKDAMRAASSGLERLAVTRARKGKAGCESYSARDTINSTSLLAYRKFRDYVLSKLR